MQEHQELKPKDVAKILNISYKKARNLMETGEIKSWVDTTADDGRKYLKTILPAIESYHMQKINKSLKVDQTRNLCKTTKKHSIEELFNQIGV